MKIYYSPRCLEFHSPGHPESPDRIRIVANHLKSLGYRFTTPGLCKEDDILLVHTQDYLEALKQGAYFDMDTPVLPGIYDHARMSAGAAIEAAEWCLQGETAFSLMRPPGHHAMRRRIMGFCYLNNIAIATARILSGRPKLKAAILDIDCHHGNGTEDVFIGNPRVLFTSLHQSPLYPGTGRESRANCLNYPLPPGTDGERYLEVLAKAAKPIDCFRPDVIGVSLGFDTHADDPLSAMGLEVDTYSLIGERIAQFRKPVFLVMEGGYSSNIGLCAGALLGAFPK